MGRPKRCEVCETSIYNCECDWCEECEKRISSPEDICALCEEHHSGKFHNECCDDSGGHCMACEHHIDDCQCFYCNRGNHKVSPDDTVWCHEEDVCEDHCECGDMCSHRWEGDFIVEIQLGDGRRTEGAKMRGIHYISRDQYIDSSNIHCSDCGREGRLVPWLPQGKVNEVYLGPERVPENTTPVIYVKVEEY